MKNRLCDKDTSVGHLLEVSFENILVVCADLLVVYNLLVCCYDILMLSYICRL